MRKNSHDRILKGEPKEQYISTVHKSYSYVIYLTLYLSFIGSILIILLLNIAFLKIWKTHLLDVGGSYQFKLCSMRLDMRRTKFVINASFLWLFKVCSSCFLVDA